MQITRAEIEAAAKRIAPYTRRTPIIDLDVPTPAGVRQVILKLDQLQHTGSFKARGALNRLLSHPIPPAGVIAASGGNHGAAVAYAAHRLHCQAEIFVPETCPPAKIALLHGYGAKVTIQGANYGEALALSEQRAAETGALTIHAYDQPEVIAGQGTVSLELSQQAPELETLIIAVGGGGLIGGQIAWYGPAMQIVGVEPEGSPTLYQALRAGEPVNVAVSGLAVDALGARRTGALAFELIVSQLQGVVLVDEAAIRAAQRLLWQELRLVVEPAGAVALAAAMSGAYQIKPDEKVGLIICGANTNLHEVANLL